MLFSLFFILASCDLYLHAPGSTTSKQVCVAVALAAVTVDRTVAYLASESLWFLLILWELINSSRAALKSAESATKPANEGLEEQEGTLPSLPPPALELMNEAWDKFTKNLDPKTSCDGCTWELVSDKDNIKIFRADIPGMSIKRWKVQLEIFGNRRKIETELFDYEKRLGAMGWDTALESGELVSEYQGGHALSVYYTAQQGGGAIASRELVDLRRLEFPESGGFKLAMVSLEEGKFKGVIKSYPKGNKKLIRGNNPPGGGCHLEPVDPTIDAESPQLFKYTMISNVDLKGWLFPSVVNAAIPTAMQDSHEAMVAHLKRTCGPQTVHAHQD